MGKANESLSSEGAQKGGTFRFTTLRTDEIIAALKPYWRTWSNADRQLLLTIPVAEALEEAESEEKRISEARTNEVYRENWQFAVAAPLDWNLTRAKNRLQNGLALKEWRWSQDPDAVAFDSPRKFWDYLEHNCIEASLVEHLPWNYTNKSNPRVANQLRDFLCELVQKAQDMQLERMLAASKNIHYVCIGDLRRGNYRDWQEGVIMMILKDLQQSPYQMLYHHVQVCLERAIKEERLPHSMSGLQFDIYSASGFLKELTNACITRVGEWLIGKIDEFRCIAKKLQGDQWGVDLEPFAMLSNDSDGDCFTVNLSWLQHLEVSKLDADALPGGDLYEYDIDFDETGLQLQWIFGSVVDKRTGLMKQALRPAGKLYTKETALDALEDALKAQQECEHARDAARSTASDILQHRRDLQGFLKLYPDMYTVQDDGCGEDDRELPDDVLLFMLSRELSLLTAKIITNQTARARAAVTPKEFREKIAEVSLRVSDIKFERVRGHYYTPDVEFQALEEEIQEHQAQRSFGNLPTVAKGYQETEVSQAEKQAARLTKWADWVETTLGYLEAFVRAQEGSAQPARIGGENNGKGCFDGEAEVKAIASMLLGSPPPPARLTPIQVQWHKDLRKQFNKVIRPKLLLEKDDKETLTAISKEIKAIEAMMVNGHASLELLAKHLENVAFSDMSAKLGHTLLPMFGKRIHEFAKYLNRNHRHQAEKAQQDLFQEEQARVAKEEQKKAKKLRKKKAKQRKLEENPASGSSGIGTVTPEEEDRAEELALPERPSLPYLKEEQPESKSAEEDEGPESQDGDFLRLLEDPDRHEKLASGPSDPSLESHNAFVVVQKKNRRLKDHPLSRGRSHPCTRDSMGAKASDSTEDVIPVLPMPMSSSHAHSTRPVRPRPPVQ